MAFPINLPFKQNSMNIKSDNPKWKRLVDYFNKYNLERWVLFTFNYTDRFDDVHIISKEDWFIKRLFKTTTMKHNVIRCCKNMCNSFNYTLVNWMRWVSEQIEPVDVLIMILSIQEDPIPFLMEILK